MSLVGVVALLLASLGSAAVAVADPGAPGLSQASSAVYPDPDTGQVLGVGEAGGNIGDPGGAFGDPGGSATETGALAFTGFSAPTLLAVSLLLIGVGLGMRRLRPKSSSERL